MPPDNRVIARRDCNKILKNIISAKKIFYHSRFYKYKNSVKDTWSIIKNIINIYKSKQEQEVPEHFQINDENIFDKSEIVKVCKTSFCNRFKFKHISEQSITIIMNN